MEAIDRVITSGASLASLLHSVATAPADFDGLLLGIWVGCQCTNMMLTNQHAHTHKGRVVRKTQAVTTDESEFGEKESTEAFLSGFLCNGGVCSFYSPVGDINGMCWSLTKQRIGHIPSPPFLKYTLPQMQLCASSNHPLAAPTFSDGLSTVQA